MTGIPHLKDIQNNWHKYELASLQKSYFVVDSMLMITKNTNDQVCGELH